MGDLIKFPRPHRKSASELNFEARMQRIRISLDKINKYMATLKEGDHKPPEESENPFKKDD